MSSVTVSVVHHSNRPLLEACLASLYGSDQGIRFDTILVDNLSGDGSVEVVRERYPSIRIIENSGRKGFGANHNQALCACASDFVFVLNDDTIVAPGTIKALCDVMDANPSAGVVGPRLTNADGTLQKSCYRFPSPLRCLAENMLLVAAFPNGRLWGDYRGWAHDSEREVDFVSGAALMARRGAFEKSGLFDESFFMYAEETDWQYRMNRAGFGVLFTPEVSVVHYGGQSTTDIKDRQFCEFYRSQMHYIRKHHGAMGAAVARAANIAGALIRIPLYGAAAIIRPGRRAAAMSTMAHWKRILAWHAGLGPREGIRELVSRPAAQADGPPA
jgi:GT2 family glycosyltransferase